MEDQTKKIVRVGIDKGWLRLRWSYQGKRYALTLGLPVSGVNKMVAAAKAHQIELDIASGHFDPSLKRYKPQCQRLTQITAADLFQLFAEEKAKQVYQRSLEKYQATINYLVQYFQDKPAQVITEALAEEFAQWLRLRHGLLVLKERLGLLKACWEWGQKKELVITNPWINLVGRIKIPPKQMPKPFTREEIGAIIQAFRSDRNYHRYADYVEFLFGTGCRTSEAIGLRWIHLSDDCSNVWIGESLSRGVRKSTKTNRARTIALTGRLQVMLQGRRPANPNPDELVFTSPTGKAIDDQNFRNRAWKTVLVRLEINYRKPYNTRHTLISHALDLGMNPVMVAQLTGHDVQTLYEQYAGVVSSRPKLPDLSEGFFTINTNLGDF
jgi:integrase